MNQQMIDSEDHGFLYFVYGQQKHLEILHNKGYVTAYIKRTQFILDRFAAFLRETKCFASLKIYSTSAIEEFIEWLPRSVPRQPYSENYRYGIQRCLRMFLKYHGFALRSDYPTLDKLDQMIEQFIAGWRCSYGDPEIVRTRILNFFSFLENRQVKNCSTISQQILDDFVSELEARPRSPQRPLSTEIKAMIRFKLKRYFRHLDSIGVITWNDECKQRRKHFLSELITKYDEFCLEAKGMSRVTLKVRGLLLDHFAMYLESLNLKDLLALKANHVEAFIATRNWSAKSLSALYSHLKIFLKYLYHEGLIPRDLTHFLVAPRIFTLTGIPKFLTEIELKRFFEEKSSPLSDAELCSRAVVYVMLFAGLRTEEVVRLRLDDVDWDNKQILIRDRKNKKPLLQILPDPAIRAIYDYVSQARPKNRNERNVFFSIGLPHDPMTAITVRSAVQHHFRARGIPGGCHRLRHTHAQLLLESGSSLDQVQASLGHEAMANTRIYTKTSMRRMRQFLVNEES